MKKVICLLCIVLLCCSLCSCDPGSYNIDREELSGVTGIELIEYDNPKQKRFRTWVSDQFDKLASFEPDKATLIEELPEENISDFLDSFAETEILHKYYAYNSPRDICVKLNYENGDFLVIWSNYMENSYAGYIGKYSADGTVLSFWGSFGDLKYYEELIDQYFIHDLN